MNLKEYQALSKALRSARKAYHAKYKPTLEVGERLDKRVLAFVAAQSAQLPRKLSFIERFTMNLRFLPSLIPTQFAYTMAAVLIIAGSAAFAGLARQALPGQTLYNTKIALEKTSVRFVSNPSVRAQVQMELAGRRLQEAEAVQKPEQKAQALKRFSKDVQEAQATLKQAADPLQVEAVAQQLAKKAKEYEEKLMAAKSAQPESSLEVAGFAQAEQALQGVRH